MTEVIKVPNQENINELSTKTNLSDQENKHISQASTQLDGSHQSNEMAKEPISSSNELPNVNSVKKDKKKKKKTSKAKIEEFKRKLSVDPNEAEVTFTNINEKKQKSKDKKHKESKNPPVNVPVAVDNDTDNEANEDFPDYKQNGYHPCHLGEILDSKYIILKKLGWGHFSTVWLAFNINDKKLYALKIMRSNKKYIQTGYDEEALCKIVSENFNKNEWKESVRKYLKDPGMPVTRDNSHCLQMYDWFFHQGHNGRHFVMAFEVLGKNLLYLIKKYNYKGIPIPIIRELTKQLLMGLDYMHRICKLIHTDLKPENINFSLREEEEFDLLYTYVLKSPLIDIFEQKDKIILNKKQQKNQKKKDRKKKKKLCDKEETKEEDKQEEITSRADYLINQMRKKLEDEDKEFFIHKQRRNQSEDSRLTTKTQQHLLQEQDKLLIQDHPLRTNPNKSTKPKQFMRVNSQDCLFSDIMNNNQFKPMDENDVRALKESKFSVKIVDMGNACYLDKKFSDIIQTRQYRSPEVIIRSDYDQSADMWSLACTIFELITGDFLFAPRKGRNYSKNEDHLALISELIGECKNTEFLLSGYKSDVSRSYNQSLQKFFDKNGKLRNIKKLKPWGLYDVLIEKYRMREFEARGLSDFLLKILKWEPKDRPTAQEMMNHYWLKMIPNYNTKMTKKELREYKKTLNMSVSSSEESNNIDQLSEGKLSDNKYAGPKNDQKKGDGEEEVKEKKQKKTKHNKKK